MRKLTIAAAVILGAYLAAWWKVAVAGPRMIRHAGERMTADIVEIRRYTDQLRERTDLSDDQKLALAQEHARTLSQAR